jgi:hypothetical protein
MGGAIASHLIPMISDQLYQELNSESPQYGEWFTMVGEETARNLPEQKITTEIPTWVWNLNTISKVKTKEYQTTCITTTPWS